MHPRIVLGIALFIAQAAPAQLVISADQQGVLTFHEPSTGAQHTAGSITGSFGFVQEMAYDPASNTVWFSAGLVNYLYELDLTTGAATFLGAFGAGASNMHGLAWDSANSTLWGVANSNNSLYSIDVASGAATLIGPTGLTGNIFSPNYLNLAYDSLRNELYATATANDSLYRIDRATGTATLIGLLNGPSNPSALAYDAATDTIYLFDNGSFQLFRVNPANGAATLVGSATGNLLGLVVLPGAGFTRESHGCGTVGLNVSGLPLTGSTVTATVAPSTNMPVIGAGVLPTNTPFCSCTIGHEWAAPLFGSSMSVSIPNSSAFQGIQLAFQAIGLLAPNGCASPPVAFSDTFVFVIG